VEPKSLKGFKEKVTVYEVELKGSTHEKYKSQKRAERVDVDGGVSSLVKYFCNGWSFNRKTEMYMFVFIL
jgi:hypothetical protein